VAPEKQSLHVALGFRVKSGWASAVVVAGPVRSPQVLERRRIELSDPAMPASRQPFHAAMGTLQTDTAKIARLRKVIMEAADRSVAELLAVQRNAGRQVATAALVVGSTTDPERITNPHIRAHALESQLFRTVLQTALRSAEVSSMILLERDLYARAAQALRRSEAELKRLATDLGRSGGGPWRADEKAATLAALLALS
jgi:hypothetical protein